MHEIQRQVLVSLPVVAGIDLSITNEVLLLWIAAIITFVLLTAACRRSSPVAKGTFRNLVEVLMEFVEKEVSIEGIGREGPAWSPFLLTLFFFILFGNLIGLAPIPSFFKPATSNINVTAALALAVFGITIVVNLRRHGLSGFFKKFLPAGVAPVVAVLLLPIEIVSWLLRPLTLAIRLFVNMMAGHALIFMFIGLVMTSAWFLKPLPYAGAVLMSCFEVFVCFIQAFVFTMLAGVYIRDALDKSH